jgi:hypothetical protein
MNVIQLKREIIEGVTHLMKGVTHLTKGVTTTMKRRKRGYGLLLLLLYKVAPPPLFL